MGNFSLRKVRQITAFQETIALDPKHAPAHYSLAQVYFLKNEKELALKYLEKAIDLDNSLNETSRKDSKFENIHRTLEYIELHHKNLQTQVDDQLEKWDKMLGLDDKNDEDVAYDHWLEGEDYRGESKFDEAIVEYQKAISLDPNQADSHFRLGWVYVQQKKLEDAIAPLQKSIALDHAWSNWAHNTLSNIYYYNQKNWQMAIKHYQQLEKNNPDNAEAHFVLARVYSLNNEPQPAIESLQKAIDLDKRLIESSKTDPDFDNIRQTPEYQQLINSY